MSQPVKPDDPEAQQETKNLGQSSSKALGSSAAARLSGIWGTSRSRARRVMAIAMTASLKDTVRRISVPLSVQCTSGALIGVSFSLYQSHTLLKAAPKGAAVASIHRDAERAGLLRIFRLRGDVFFLFLQNGRT